MRARIRDFIETVDGWIFAVVDYHHPDGIRSILRYVPDPAGERAAGGLRYRKLDFEEAYDLLRKARPEYVRDVHVVPEEEVLRIYRPDEELPKAAERDDRIAEIVSVLRKGGVPDGKMGITGSVLVGLEGPASDIDFLVYGSAWWRARDVIAAAKEEGGRIRDLDEATWDKIYRKRVPDIDRREFVLHERRKGNRGLVDKTYFDLLFTRDWDQIGPPF
ncbi:MAG: nucleotidyltransferase domain-containing protein, partial [Methanothrix sp.]